MGLVYANWLYLQGQRIETGRKRGRDSEILNKHIQEETERHRRRNRETEKQRDRDKDKQKDRDRETAKQI